MITTPENFSGVVFYAFFKKSLMNVIPSERSEPRNLKGQPSAEIFERPLGYARGDTVMGRFAMTP